MSHDGTLHEQRAGQRQDERPARLRVPAPGWLLAITGGLAVIAVAVAEPAAAGQAAGQDWQPFVLVTGLLLIGLVADRDGLFEAGGHQLARLARVALYCGAAVLIGVVTALLNLDTSVAFLTPVLVYTARRRDGGEAPLLYGCLLLSNAGSLLLPGSNLTNLIVLGHLHLSGAAFLSRMWLAWLAALVVTAAALAVIERRELLITAVEPGTSARRPVLGLGLAAVISATVIVVALRAPAVPVVAVGLAALTVRGWQRRLAARTPGHPFALLVGLNIGPNLLASGSLAWILWLKSARTAGAGPSLRRATRLGAVTVPLAMAAALAALMLAGGAG